MDLHIYCQEAIAEVHAQRARRGWDPDSSQRAVVLSYLFEQRPFAPDFERQLEDLAVTARHGQPGVAAAAQAILADWRERARSTVMVRPPDALDAVSVSMP